MLLAEDWMWPLFGKMNFLRLIGHNEMYTTGEISNMFVIYIQ